MDGAQLLGVKMLCATLEGRLIYFPSFKKLKHISIFLLLGASLRGCNFEDPAGSRANMEGDLPVYYLNS